MTAELLTIISLACGDFSTLHQDACRRALEASVTQTGVAGITDQTRSYIETETNKRVNKEMLVLVGFTVKYLNTKSIQYKARIWRGFSLGAEKDTNESKGIAGYAWGF